MKRFYFSIILFVLFNLIFGFFYFSSQVFADTSTTVVSTVKISICGDGIQEGSEQCDIDDLAGATCSTFGYSSGSLSCTAACDFDTSACYTPPTPPSGGGGGGVLPPPPVETKVSFSGKAFPMSTISILKDGQVAVTTISGPDASFSASISGLSAGNYVFSVVGQDEFGNRSLVFSFPLYITSGVTTNISGIFLSPIIAVDRDKVKYGDDITFFGFSVPSSEVTIAVSSDEEMFVSTRSNENGVYLYRFNTAPLVLGQHSAKSKAAVGGEITPYSQSIGFLVQDLDDLDGDEPIIPPGQLKKGDLNDDGKVDLIDFSIGAFWYKRPLTEKFRLKEAKRLNGDNKIDLIDFSIMAYHWTG